jgi:tetratricopeptide (TPR) repeat protein
MILPWLATALMGPVSEARADRAEEYWQKGEELYESHHLAPNRFERALEWYEKALSVRKGDYELLWELSKRYQIYGQTLGKAQRKQKLEAWRKGLEYGRKATEVNPGGKEGHFYYMANLGAIAQMKGTLTSLMKLGAIKREMDRTLELDPDWPPALLARAQYLIEMPGIFGGDKDEALRLCRRAIELDPDHLPAYVTLARILVEDRRYEEALAALDKVFLCENPRQYANYLKVDRPRAEQVRKEIEERRAHAR